MYATSLPDCGSILELSSHQDSPSSLPQFPYQSAHATSLDFDITNAQWQQKEPVYPVSYGASKVILFKGVPEDLDEAEILNLCEVFGTIKDLFLKKQKRYAFIQFDKVEHAQRCFESFSKIPATIRGHPLYVFHTGKDKITKSTGLVNPPSRFLLLAFNKVTFNIDKNIIAQLLGSYGRCVKIIALQTKNLQYFVEMEDVTQAIHAKESLDGQIVFGMTTIGVLYTEEKDVFTHMQPVMSNSNYGVSTMETLDHMNYSPKGMISNASFTKTWEEPQNPNLCTWPNMLFSTSKPVSLPNNISYQQPRQQNRPENYTKPSSLNLQAFHEKPYKNFNDNQQKSATLVSPLFHTQEEKSPTILLIKNLPKGLTARILFRLFGMYGNVMKVKIFFKNPENALVEYQTAEQAELAKTYLNNCPLYGNNIFVTNSKVGVAIDTSSLKRGEEGQFMGDYSTSPEHRYKFSGSKNYGNIVPPSKVIHLSNLCEDKNEMFYADLFRDFGIIRKFTFLKGPERMALMEMGSVEETVKILSNFHNFNINGKYLKVSFSKYQKIKDL